MPATHKAAISGFKAMEQTKKAVRAPVSVEAQEVHKYLMDFSWNFASNRTKYGTKYEFANMTKEQYKLTAKEYARMEAIKEERQFGTLLDGLDRMGGARRVHPRWNEAMKVISNYLEVGEYNAIAGSALLWDSAQSPEQKNGYLAQVLDEIRHTHQTAYVNYYFSKHSYDPSGHNNARQVRAIGPAFRGMKRVFGDGFNAGDPVECSLNLQLVGEACFTNPLIVAVTEWAAANGDEITPTVFTSIQTDEMRHMANGYQTVVSVINDPKAKEHINADLNNAFWTQTKYFTPVLGYLFEYFSPFKVEPWAKTWNRWVYEDWAGIWIGRLAKYGVEVPKSMKEAKLDAVWAHHDLALLAYALWPFAHYSHELPSEQEMGWFEENYPGWYNHYGKIYDEWRKLGFEDPKSGFLPFQWLIDKGYIPYIDHTSGVPFCPKLAKSSVDLRILERNGRRFAFADKWGEQQYLLEPDRYEACDFLTEFDGWEASQIIRAGGGLRSDGKTLVAQPHTRSDNMWTIEDIERIGAKIINPLRLN